MLAMVVEYAAAHEHRHVKIGDREVEFIVGWAIEPAYAGVPNKVDLRVLALVEEHEHEHDEHGHAGESRKVPVLGLEKYLKVEVSTGGKSIILNLRPAWGDPGRYFADIVPTVPGTYVFRFFGNVNGTEVNEIFDCSEGRFHCVEPLSKIMFPEVTQPTDELQRTLAEIRKDHEQVAKRLDQLSVAVDSMAKMHEQMMNTDARLESSINSVSAIAYGGLGAGIIGLIVAIVSLIRRPR
jgi:hypothetical protein